MLVTDLPTHSQILTNEVACLAEATPEGFADAIVRLAEDAGLREELHGRASGAVRTFALYGETSGETDEFGLPVRYNWAAEYRGRAVVVAATAESGVSVVATPGKAVG